MIDWIARTECGTCKHVEMDVFQNSSGGVGAALDVNCPRCGKPARLLTFPAFDIETIDTSLPARFSYETLEDR